MTTFANPFARAAKIQADGKGSWIPCGTHHFRLLALSIDASADPDARPGTSVVVANFECLDTQAPTAAQLAGFAVGAVGQKGRQYDRVWVFPPEIGASKNDLDQIERNLRETKQLFQALVGLHAHEGDAFDALCVSFGMDQATFMLGVCQPDNPLGGKEVFCEGVNVKLRSNPGVPFVRSNWHPVKAG